MLGVVKEGGVVVVRVPYKEDLKIYLHPDFPYDFVHLRSFDENSLRILFEKILNVQVLEITFTGYRCGNPKIGANLRYYAGVVRRIMNVVQLLPGNIYTYISQRVLQPVEINIVIRNSKMDPRRSR